MAAVTTLANTDLFSLNKATSHFYFLNTFILPEYFLYTSDLSNTINCTISGKVMQKIKSKCLWRKRSSFPIDIYSKFLWAPFPI